MSKSRIVGLSVLWLLTVCVTRAGADDISASKVQVKDNANVSKRKLQVQSKDAAVLFANADDPSANKAAIHVYSVTDDLCIKLPSGTDWTSNGSQWKYKNKATKNSAQVKDGLLKVKIKSGVAYSLNEPSQGTVNVQVQFGSGTRYCMKCTSPTKDDNKNYLAKSCAAAACDAEPSTCDPLATTTTTTTVCPAPGQTLYGALTATPGRFNYNATLGLPGANAACAANFACTHACTYAELQTAEAAGELVGLMDIAANTVTSFWAIDNAQPALQQCQDDVGGGSFLNWEYGTAHTASRGQRVALTNGTGVLGPLMSSVQCNISGSSWVGCCL